MTFSFRKYSFQKMASYYSNGNGCFEGYCYSQYRSVEQRDFLFQKFKETWFYNNCFGSINGHNISWNMFPHILFLAQDIVYISV